MADRRRPRTLARSHTPLGGPAPSPPPEPSARKGAKKPSRRIAREIGATVVGRVLILDEDNATASAIADALAQDGHAVDLAASIPDGVLRARRYTPDVIVVDPYGRNGGGDETLDELRSLKDSTGRAPEIVVVTNLHDVDAAVSALHRGAADYLLKPVTAVRLRLSITRALERLRLLSENERLREDLALVAAAQRILEAGDERELARYGMDALLSFTLAQAGALYSATEVFDRRHVSEAEVAVLQSLARPMSFTDRRPAAEVASSLARFSEVLAIDLDGTRTAAVFSSKGFDGKDEQAALFLTRQLQTAYRNILRFADAEREARLDALTGLWNARTFAQAVDTQAQKQAALFSLLFLDVDHFKQVNDRFGHVTGSRVLQEIAQVLTSCLREGDLVARYGGDEFTVLLPEVDAETAMRVAERIRATIEAHRFSSSVAQASSLGASVPITVCVGVASFPQHAQSAGALLDMADRAMYFGKGSMRNAVHLASEVPRGQPEGRS